MSLGTRSLVSGARSSYRSAPWLVARWVAISSSGVSAGSCHRATSGSGSRLGRSGMSAWAFAVPGLRSTYGG